MAITSLDTQLAGIQPSLYYFKPFTSIEAVGQFFNLITLGGGNPPAATLGTPGLAGEQVDNTSAIGGFFKFVNPVTGNTYLASFSVGGGQGVLALILYDLLWYNTGIAITTTTAQTVGSTGWPARDAAGGTTGVGVEIWLFASAATGNAGAIANTTISYTNTATTSGRTAGLVYSWPATAVVRTMVPFGLQAGDIGIQNVDSLTLGTSYVSGTVNLLAVRRIGSVYLDAPLSGVSTSGVARRADAFGLGLPQIFNSSALFLTSIGSTASAGPWAGEIVYVKG